MTAWTGKAASILLVLCFVLPLSMCSKKDFDLNGKAVTTDVYAYGYELAIQGWTDLKGGDLLAGAGLLFAVFTVFFLPIVCWKLKEKPQSILLFLSAFPAGYFLYLWVFVFVTFSEYGGIIAVGCWGVLFVISAEVILRWLCRKVFMPDAPVRSSRSRARGR